VAEELHDWEIYDPDSEYQVRVDHVTLEHAKSVHANLVGSPGLPSNLRIRQLDVPPKRSLWDKIVNG
jgi:hypothetical protein